MVNQLHSADRLLTGYRFLNQWILLQVRLEYAKFLWTDMIRVNKSRTT
jgi:hypothetical protein